MERNRKLIDLFEPLLTFAYARCCLGSFCLCRRTILLISLCLAINTLISRLKLEGHGLGVSIFIEGGFLVFHFIDVSASQLS
jgi:hypothetical protein